MSQLDTLPDSVDVATGEFVTYNFDTTGYLSSGESLLASPAPSAAIYLASTHSTVSNVIQASPGINGNLLQVNLDCSHLAAKQSYSLVITFYVTTTKRLQARVQVNCIF